MSESVIACSVCGTELTDENTYAGATVCGKCQERYYSELERTNGCHLALFLSCAAFNVPCVPSVVPIDLVKYEGDKWAHYRQLLSENKKDRKKSRLATFLDGVTNIREIFGRDLTEKDFARYVAAEQKRTSTQAGTPEQRERWGVGELCRGLPLTQELYDELDSQLELWIERYKGQTITPQLENSIITICSDNMVAKHLVKIGNYAAAQKMRKMVDDLMASEQMRKKDEKPIESLRLDAWVTALERAGFMESGKLKTYEEVAKAINEECLCKRKYDYTLDVADQMLADYVNNLRSNADMALLSMFPSDMKPIDGNGEFATEESTDERERKRYAGVTAIQFGDGSGGE